jgi:hypothetical protein
VKTGARAGFIADTDQPWRPRKQAYIAHLPSAGPAYRTMGAPVAETTVVNRCRSEDTYESRLAAGTLPLQVEPPAGPAAEG